MSNIDSLIHDIYNLLEDKEVPEGINLEEERERFGRNVAEQLLSACSPDDDRRGLRLSAIGKPDRQVYNSVHGVDSAPIRGATHIKFLYGHIIEALLVALTRISGHTVSDEQKRVEVEGVVGHMDCRIDGMLVDVKSCSSFGFKKFRNHELHKDDPFGYIGQLKAYAYAEGDTEYAWLAMDKQNGTLALMKYDETNTETEYYDSINWCAAERVRELKKLVGSDMPPQVCYEPVPDGKSGNMKLDTGCAWCSYREHCWPDAKVYLYSNGPRYLTEVVKEPRVLEVPSEF